MSTNKQQERNIETFVRSQKLFFEILKILIKKLEIEAVFFFGWLLLDTTIISHSHPRFDKTRYNQFLVV